MTDAAPMSADPTRDRLIEAAAAVFAEKGYDGAGVQEIARRAGFTTGAIYGRFRGKAELLLAAIEAHTHNELEQLFADHRFEGRVTDVLNIVGSHLLTDPFDAGQALLLEAFVAARRDPEVAALMRDLMRQRAETFAELVDDAKRSGLVVEELDTESIVRFCHAVGFGFLLFGAIDLQPPQAAPWERLIAQLVRALGQPVEE
ncbi:MAG TPA: helix-turn-helix domain-containing protein [Acidimicrobiales bacterium]|nr:helix-turn-helix domain-containing protein [Acidimicrobiales bacterium]